MDPQREIYVRRHGCVYIPTVIPTLLLVHCAIFPFPSGYVAAVCCDEFKLVCTCQVYCEKSLWGFKFQDIELMKSNWDYKADEHMKSSTHPRERHPSHVSYALEKACTATHQMFTQDTIFFLQIHSYILVNETFERFLISLIFNDHVSLVALDCRDSWMRKRNCKT